MKQKLKMTTSRAVAGVIFVSIILAGDVFLVYLMLKNEESFAGYWVALACTIVAVIYSLILFYNGIIRPLTFNDRNFTYKGKTYTYQQIEKVQTKHHNNKVWWEIYVDGKMIYKFDEYFVGMKDFFYYIDYYNVQVF